MIFKANKATVQVHNLSMRCPKTLRRLTISSLTGRDAILKLMQNDNQINLIVNRRLQISSFIQANLYIICSY